MKKKNITFIFVFFFLGILLNMNYYLIETYLIEVLNSKMQLIIVTASCMLSVIFYLISLYYYYYFLIGVKGNKKILANSIFVIMLIVAIYTSATLVFITAMYWG
ncbi:hypothetical protein ACFSFY_06275 [Sporosarcina siberiensis]|uniref:Uncharacterized protein n=1 Tax=Sporosarcina siberiensis TaxID=1365606 RepID=A0ABW4SGC2_9BACL